MKPNSFFEPALKKEFVLLSESTPATQSKSSLTRTTFQEARLAHQDEVFRFVSRRVKPVEVAEDITAETFLDAFRYWRKCKSSPRTWLLGIARRKVADHYRKTKKHFSLQSGDGAAGSAMDDFVADFEARKALEILEELREDEREVLTLQILEELSIEDIAEVIGRSYAATNSLLQRARQRARQLADSGDNQ